MGLPVNVKQLIARHGAMHVDGEGEIFRRRYYLLAAHYIREKYGSFNALAHVEFTRLLSEHGIGGALIILVLVFFSVWYTSSVRSTVGKAISAGMFSLALLNTFHAAMRTNTSMVFYALAAVPIIYSTGKRSARPSVEYIPLAHAKEANI